ncbi:TetR/AcrR family transcriptional regulator [Ammoniphilus sp. 3BR4]|uniref:TetR/AcrR family transcriptional regulator n=1 Tax=Ammoniphilus sp. 3BR4 TaxID=3158265 RepID=UPI0034665136
MKTKKDLIYEGALKAFSQYEISEARMDDIAELASVAKGTLYYYFKTKEELFLFVMEKGMDKLLQHVDQVIQSDLPRDNMLYNLLKVHLQFFAEEKELCQLLVSKAWGSQNLHLQVQQIIRRYFEKMEAFYGLLQKEGVIASTVDIPTLTSSLFGMIMFTALRQIELGQEVNTREIRSSLRMLCNGVIKAGELDPKKQ